MLQVKRTHAKGLAPINVQEQVSATHNTAFPFSPLGVDDHGSVKSICTGHTALSQNPFISPGSSTTTLTDYESGATSDHDAWHLERYSEVSKSQKNQLLSAPKPVEKTLGRSSGLQIITDFSKPTYHANNLVIDQVSARQAVTRANHARSIVSQKGVKIDVVDTRSSNGDGDEKKKRKREAVLLPSNNSSPAVGCAQSQKSILIGFCVPQHEANVLHHQDEVKHGFTLDAPQAPTIILTPPEEKLIRFPTGKLALPEKNIKARPASSVYSTITCSRDVDHDEEDIPPLPALPSFIKTSNNFTPANSQLPTAHQKIHNENKLHIDSSPRAYDGCDTPRSQGWWNLLLSPLLSRNGSSASRRLYEMDASPPPVPDMPKKFDDIVVINTPKSTTSPETPRRLGLAVTPSGAWSNWAEWEHSVTSGTKHIAMDDETTTKEPISAFPEKVFPIKEPLPDVKEGLAAEYYYACAIEQLSGATFFECINHSCQEQLPKLAGCGSATRHINEIAPMNAASQPASSKLIVLGSPFKGDQASRSNAVIVPEMPVSHEAGSVTDIESDDDFDDEHHVTPDQIQPKAQRALRSIDSDDEPDELSPNVRKANTAAFIKGRARGITEMAKSTPKLQPSEGSKEIPNIAAFVTVPPLAHATLPASPKPVKSKTTASARTLNKPIPALPTAFTPPAPDIFYDQQDRGPFQKHQMISQQFFMNPNGGISGLPSTPAAVPTFQRPTVRRASSVTMSQASSFTNEKKGLTVNHNRKRDSRSCTRITNFFRSKNGATKDEKKKKKRRRCALCICILLLLIIILCIILAITITRRGNDTPVQSRWLNLTGYPPMPIGISTVAQPVLAQSQSGCVQPATLWSCALPKDDPQRGTTNGSGIPDFRFEIQYQNGTTPANMNIPLTKRQNDPSTPNPAPPNDADQIFLGKTTDNITAPFDGEVTPFYITFMSTYPVVPAAFNNSKRSLDGRQANLGINIPAPNTLSDGTAVPATLLPTDPFPTSQPVRLYNRGLIDEHYGFYMYYDKPIFLSGITISGGNASTTNAGTTADQDGGATKNTANVQCTWKQTRFLVKIYTNSKFDGSIFAGRPNTMLDTSKASEYNSATNFDRPGSFPYPTSIIIDRHGGNINTKINYCYAMDKGEIDPSNKVLVFEDRSAGGTLINGAPSFVDPSSSNQSFDSSAGGIDGGTGGCGCTWQNWT